jgi:hypothetical protein
LNSKGRDEHAFGARPRRAAAVDQAGASEQEAVTLPLDHAFFELADVSPVAIKMLRQLPTR